MRIIVADWETFFDSKEYTLKRMTTESYIRDPRFEPHGVAVKWEPALGAVWYRPDEFREVAMRTDWNDVFLIHHHAQFDGLIEIHHFGINPKAFGCTLAMARLLLGSHISVSLDSVRKHFGMEAKRTPYHLFDGKHWDELDDYAKKEIAAGACDEVESIWNLFNLLAKDFPQEEYPVVDTTIRMFTNPVLQGDVDLLAHIWEEEEKSKVGRMEALGVTEAQLQSAETFAGLLRDAGVEPQKKSGKKWDIYAFAKTDDFMRELLEDADDRVRALAEIRLGVKSTYMQTRAETWGYMASRGPMCVYLSYAGTGTLRPSGGDSTNFLNMKRQSQLRRALRAPDGWKLCPVDSSQIECRVLHYLAGGPDEPVVQKFRNHEDPYVDLASKFYQETIYKPKKDDPRKDEMEAKRGMGKQGRLMCGYGASGKQFKVTAKNGTYGPSVEISIEDADAFVVLYRKDNPSVCAPNSGYWAQAGRMLARLAGGPPVDWGPLHVRDHRIYLPGGQPMIYDSLEYYRPTEEEREALMEAGKYFKLDGWWRMRTRRGWKEMWGSKLTQNICEAVSRVVVTQAMNRITAMGYRVLNHPYDELLCLIPDEGKDEYHQAVLETEMRREVPWLPGLPLDCESIVDVIYKK